MSIVLNASHAQLDTAARQLSWMQVGMAEAIGGVVLTYRTAAPARVVIRIADTETALTLPSCKSWNTQLFALTPAAEGCHDVSIIGQAEIRQAVFYPAACVVCGSNPVLPVDMPDPDIVRVGDTYYMASTTMHFCPGCTLLRSYDLIQWEIIGYLYDQLPLSDARCLKGSHIYGKGMWAPSLRWHKGTFHICFSANDTHCTYHYWSTDIAGPWQMDVMEGFYHDCSLFFDEDDRAYMVYGNNKVYLTELDDALHGPRKGGLHRLLLEYGPLHTLGYEGSHLYKHDGRYYLFTIHSNRNEWYREESVFCADDLHGRLIGGVALHDDMGYHHQGIAQGGMIDTLDGRWFAYMFQDRGASGRIPMLMPMHWSGGMPVLGCDGAVPTAVCNLSTHPGHAYAPMFHDDDFSDAALSSVWQWNHIPRLELIKQGCGELRITTDQVSSTLTETPNLLTQRAPEPICTAEVTVCADLLASGDQAGLCVFQGCFAAAAICKSETGYELAVIARSPEDAPCGVVRKALPWSGSSVDFRVVMDFTDMRDQASLYVRCGSTWEPLLIDHPMRFTPDHFVGNRAGLFVRSTQQAGGTAIFRHFRIRQGG